MDVDELEPVDLTRCHDDCFSIANSELFGLVRSKSERSSSAEERIEWLRSQLIGGGGGGGGDVEFETPFGKRLLTYADHAATGRSLRYIEDYILQQVLPFYGNTHTDDSFVGSTTTRMVHRAADYVKRCMGGGRGDALIFCGAGSSAAIKRLQEVMGIALPSPLRDRMAAAGTTALLRDEERWVVFVGPYEHHSNLLSWRQTTAEVVQIGADDDGLLDVAELGLRLGSPEYADRPMLGSFSACSNVTGVLTDSRSVARLLHRHGAFACFDFATSGPYVEMEMRSGEVEGYDAVFVSPHKFVGGPATPGILLMNKALYRLHNSPPSTCAGGTVSYVNGFSELDTIYYDEIELREDGGTPPIIQKVRAALAFWVKEYVGLHFIRLHEKAYSEAAMARLLSSPNLLVLGNQNGARRLPIFSFLVFPPDPEPSNNISTTTMRKPLNGRFVAKLLNDLFGIQARGGCQCAGPYGHLLLGIDRELSLRLRSAVEEGYLGVRPGWTRISFAYYTSKEEFAFILASVDFVAAHGHRFLPLYQLDWATGDWSFRKSALKFRLLKEELALATDAFLGSDGHKFAAGVKRKERKLKARNLGASNGGREDDGSKRRGVSSSYDHRFEYYLERAQRIALSLPDDPPSSSVPEGLDPTLVFFRI